MILDAVVQIVAERGVARASVGAVIARAKVSRPTFYEHFEGLEDALIAVMDRGMQRATPLIVQGFAGTDSWQDGMRCALGAILAFCDSEPALVRVCLMEAQAAGPRVRGHRERILKAFRALVVERIESEVSPVSQLAPEGVLASVVGIVGARLIAPEPQPLIELLGPLMGIIVGPFMDEAQVASEIAKGDELAQQILAERAQLPAPGTDELELADVEIPAMLRNARAQRARMCVRYLAAQGRKGISPSNREIAAGIGIANEGQISKLLIRLERGAVVSKFSHGVGRPNAWRLTPYGEELAAHFEHRESS